MRHRKQENKDALQQQTKATREDKSTTGSSFADMFGSTQLPSWSQSEFIVFLCLLFFRIVNAWMVKTHFDPDEYWQVLEPARLLVYGQGWLTWEWAPTVALRSWVHPILFSFPWFGTWNLFCINLKTKMKN